MYIKSSRIVAGAAVLAALALSGNASAFTVVPFVDGPNDQYGVNNTAVPKPGYPDFWSYNGSGSLTQGTMRLANGGKAQDFIFTYTDTYSSHGCPSCSAVFNFPSGAYMVSNLSLTLTATFMPNGQFVSGNYSIVGSLPGSNSPTYGSKPSGYSWGSVATTTLFSAALTGANVDPTNEGLGFKTSNFGGWANQPQFTGTGPNGSESIWIYSQLTCQTGSQSSPLCSANKNGNSLWASFLDQLKNDNLNVTGKFSGLAAIATVPLPGALLLFGSGLMGLGGVFRRRRRAAGASA